MYARNIWMCAYAYENVKIEESENFQFETKISLKLSLKNKQSLNIWVRLPWYSFQSGENFDSQIFFGKLDQVVCSHNLQNYEHEILFKILSVYPKIRDKWANETFTKTSLDGTFSNKIIWIRLQVFRKLWALWNANCPMCMIQRGKLFMPQIDHRIHIFLFSIHAFYPVKIITAEQKHFIVVIHYRNYSATWVRKDFLLH